MGGCSESHEGDYKEIYTWKDKLEGGRVWHECVEDE